MSRVEQPKYLVERADGPMERRCYPKMVVAETVVSGAREAAVNNGFRSLACYIFGANVDGKKIEMTAPVLQERNSATAESITDKKEDWIVRFVMPREWPKDSLPKPRDPRVNIETLPASRFAVNRFSGRWRDTLLQQKSDELRAYVARHKLIAKGAPIYAFYNPPWTLPFLRRNEVLIEIER